MKKAFDNILRITGVLSLLGLLTVAVLFAQERVHSPVFSGTISSRGGNITWNGAFTHGGATTLNSIVIADQVVTDAATYAVLAANSGKIHVIGDLSQNTTINLPAEVDGLNYEFWYVGAAADAHDHTIDSEAAANFFIGGISFLDTDAGDAADEVHAGIYSDGNSNSIMTLNNLAAGTIVKFTCDGTNWYITGQVLSDTVPTLTDQA